MLASCNATALVSGACSAPPQYAVFYNNTNNYSLSGADFVTSLTASYNATPSSNTCQYKCNSGYSWDGVSCNALPVIDCGSASHSYSGTIGASWCKFVYTGTSQSLTVTSGAGNVTVKLWGAGGGGYTISGGGRSSGGAGGYTTGALPVTSGDVFTIIVGQGGTYGNTTSYG